VIDRVIVDGSPLTPAAVVAVAHRRADAATGSIEERMAPARQLVERVLDRGDTVYGITTGFGALASTHVEPDAAAQLQVRLVRSHAAGVGPELAAPMVRAMLLLRARTLAQGHSGVRPAIVRRLIDFIRLDLLPVVPSQGSVGASGDLAPFAHMALPIIGEGEVRFEGRRMPAADALAAAGLEPIVLEAKEGLSLLNGTDGMLAMGVLALDRARRLADVADLACAMSVEALLGSARPFESRIHEVRPHPGQIASARRIAGLLDGSEIVASHADDFVHAVQDAYSLRCAPQVHGAARDVFENAAATFGHELGAVADNPLVFADDDTGDVVSGGNFHGQPLAFAMDFMAIAATELGSISERRTDRMLDPDRSAGLPAFLAAEPGLNSGFMLAQYTAAALVAENRVLAHPASVESIPTSGLQEDHVSMGWGAGRKLEMVLDNTVRVLAVELLCAAQGMDMRSPLRSAESTSAALAAVRTVVSTLEEDRPLGDDIEAMARAVEDGLFDSVLAASDAGRGDD
jgi:histidine ammonia-lyase